MRSFLRDLIKALTRTSPGKRGIDPLDAAIVLIGLGLALLCAGWQNIV